MSKLRGEDSRISEVLDDLKDPVVRAWLRLAVLSREQSAASRYLWIAHERDLDSVGVTFHIAQVLALLGGKREVSHLQHDLRLMGLDNSSIAVIGAEVTQARERRRLIQQTIKEEPPRVVWRRGHHEDFDSLRYEQDDEPPYCFGHEDFVDTEEYYYY